MPAYDFRCIECETVCEVTRPVGATDPVPCPECGGDTKRVFSPVGVVFKGSGFHNTDYRSTSEGKQDAPKTCPSSDTSSDACSKCPAAAESD